MLNCLHLTQLLLRMSAVHLRAPGKLGIYRYLSGLLTDASKMAASASSAAGGKLSYSATYVSVCLAINVALSISIILLNKAVYTHVRFPNMTLTCVHFTFTTVGMVCCRLFGLFTFKSLPLRHMVPVSLTFCGFVVLTNLSLQSNTVGTYQIIKSMTTPVIIFIQTVFYARIFSLPVKLTLVVLLTWFNYS